MLDINNLKEIKDIINIIKDKKVLILGFGREGKSTLNLLLSLDKNLDIDIADLDENITLDNTVIPNINNIKVFTGNSYLQHIKDYDVIFKSPGIVLDKDKYPDKIITSQTELFLSVYKNQCVGVTGTKGKSTVASLIHHTLITNNKDAILCGNIGKPCFDVIDEINENTIIVLELSCHQLNKINVSPHISILLNIYEDHLDYYGSFKLYAENKHNIYLNQNIHDILIVLDEIELNKNIKSKVIKLSSDIVDLKLEEAMNKSNLKGKHNLYNCYITLEVIKQFGLDYNDLVESLKTFNSLEHRLEFVGEILGINYYNDSISTTAESTICALSSIEKIGTILIGGMDRGINYEPLVEYLCNLDFNINVILMYASGRRIYEMLNGKLNNNIKAYIVDDLEKGVSLAKTLTNKGEACVLSPAAASYGDFKNFIERGNKFKEFIK